MGFIANWSFLGVETTDTTVIEQVMAWLTAIIDGFISIFQTLFGNEGLLSIFYTTADGLTIVGGLLLIAFGYKLSRWAFSWIRGLLSLKG